MEGGGSTAAELDVVHPSGDVKADGLLDIVIAPGEIREVSAEDSEIVVVELDAIHPSEDMKADGLVDTVVASEEVREVSAGDSEIVVVELDVTHPSEDMKADGLVDPVVASEEIREVSVGASEIAVVELDVVHASEDMKADGLVDTVVAPEETRDVSAGESEIVVVELAILPGETEGRSNSEQIKINETSSAHSVETTETRVSTGETNVVETSLEIVTETLIQTAMDKVEDTQEATLKTETVREETLIQTTVDKIEEDFRMESLDERTEEQQPSVTFQDMVTEVTKDEGILWDEPLDNAINPVDTTEVEKEEDTEMVDPPAAEQEGGEAVTITEAMVLEVESGATTDDDLIDPEAGLVASEDKIDTTISITTIQHDSGGAVGEGVDSHGVLIGVGSSVESSGLTITEIADTTAIVDDQQSAWGLSEHLITPPEEEIIEAIGDLCGAVDDILDKEEPPQSTEGLALVVIVEDADNELHDLQTTSFDGETQTPSETTIDTQTSQHAAQSSKRVILDGMEPQAPNDTVVVDMAEPLDLQDVHSLLPTSTETETETADIAAAFVSRPLSPPENKQPTDIVAEDIAVQEGSVHAQQDGIPAVAEAVEKGLPIEEQDVSLPREELTSEARSVEVAAEDGTSLPQAFEAEPVSISMSSIDESTTAMVEQVTIFDQDNSVTTTAGAASDVVALSADGLGLGLEAAAVDSSVVSSEARAMESTEVGVVVPVVEPDMDEKSNDQVVECALDGSTYVVVDGLETGEALERKEKKRGRVEEGDAVAEDEEKTPKTAKTSNGEIPVLNDVGATDGEICEDAQVDKKRPREELEAVLAEPDVSIQTKLQKTGTVGDDAVSQSCTADTEEEADAEECADMEDKEEAQEKSVNGAGQDPTAPRYKKRKIALFLGYSGAGYQGMQKNPGAITIEGELEEALFRAGAIAESNYGQPQKLDWRRAARTDKGVSAVGQVVSGCFFIDPPGFIERVNSHLPKQIRVYGYKRATASFNAKKLCDRRKYEYVLPVYAFDPTVHLDRETAQALAAAEKVHSLIETEIKATVTKISGPAGETEVSMVIESEMKETITEEGDTRALVEPVGETVVNSLTEASNNVIPKIEGQEDNQSSSNGMEITEKVSTVTETAQENVAAGIPVQTDETLLETKEVTLVETGVDLSPEEKKALDEKAITAPVEVLPQTKEVSAERTEVNVTETVIDLSAEERREALDEKVKKSTYKFDEAESNRLNRILGGFVGHHNFHNFTVRTKATDPSANRYIISFGVENTFTIDGIEFVRCSVVGQSFMLHQIRKMIGLAVAIMRGTAPESTLATALRRDTKINVPMAPELGLFLEECYYSAYNRRFKATHEDMSLSSFSSEVNEFKKEFIYPHIGSTEARDSTFAMWLHSLNDRHYPDFVAAREAEKLIKSQ